MYDAAMTEEADGPKKVWLTAEFWSAVAAGVSAVVTAIALIVGWRTLLIARDQLDAATETPIIKLTPPKHIRVELGPDYNTLYLQPSFTVTNTTTRSGYIHEMELHVRVVREGAENTPEEPFVWRYVVKFRWSVEKQEEEYGDRLSDAVALPVALNAPQTPMAEFVSPNGYFENHLRDLLAGTGVPVQPPCFQLRLTVQTSSGPDETTMWLWLTAKDWQTLEAGKRANMEAVAAGKTGQDVPPVPYELALARDATARCPP